MNLSRFQLKGRTAMVTGAAGGIGKAIAGILSEAGARVWLHDLEGNSATEQVREGLRAKGAEVDVVFGDLEKTGGGALLAAEVLRREPFGIDILVLNASLQIRKPWQEITAVDFERQMRMNVLSSLELMQGLIPPMQTRRWGRILVLGSVQQTRPHPDMAVYAASKAALGNLVCNFAPQLAPQGISINCLSPGVILTDRTVGALSDPSYEQKVRAEIPCGFFGTPEDCAGTALLLCSEAGRYITGQNFPVDGGFSLP